MTNFSKFPIHKIQSEYIKSEKSETSYIVNYFLIFSLNFTIDNQI